MVIVNISSRDSAIEHCFQVFEKLWTAEGKNKEKFDRMTLSHEGFNLPNKSKRGKKCHWLQTSFRGRKVTLKAESEERKS